MTNSNTIPQFRHILLFFILGFFGVFAFMGLPNSAKAVNCQAVGASLFCVTVSFSPNSLHQAYWDISYSPDLPTVCATEGGAYSESISTNPVGLAPGVVNRPLSPPLIASASFTSNCSGTTSSTDWSITDSGSVGIVHEMEATWSGPTSFPFGTPQSWNFDGGYTADDLAEGGSGQTFTYRIEVTPPADFLAGEQVGMTDTMSITRGGGQCSEACDCQYGGPTCCGDPSTCASCGTYCTSRGLGPSLYCWNFLSNQEDQIGACSTACGATYEISYRVRSSDNVTFTEDIRNVTPTCPPPPPPQIYIWPSSITFGEVESNSTFFADASYFVANVGGGTLNGSVGLSNGTHFSLLCTPNCTYSLAQGETAQFDVRFQPTALGNLSDTLNFTGAGGGSASAFGTGVTIAISAALVDFGGVKINTTKSIDIQVVNSGSGTISDTFAIRRTDYVDSPPPPDIFECVSTQTLAFGAIPAGPVLPGCAPFTIVPGQSVQMTVSFTPDDMRPYNAEMFLQLRPTKFFSITGHGLFVVNIREF